MGPTKRYERGKQLGEGRSGVIFEARDLALDRRVAFKILNEGFHLEPQIKSHFVFDGLVSPALLHPSIAALYDVGELEGSEYVVTELLTGTDERSASSLEFPFSLLQTLDVMSRICDGIAHAHRHGILHLNIHPGNVFIGSGHGPKVLDLGIQREYVAGQEQAAEYCLVSAYAAPEYVLGQAPDARCDVYSLGVIFFDLVAKVERLEAFELPFPASLQTLLNRAVEKSPDDRIQTAEEFGAGIGSIAATLLRARFSPNAASRGSSSPPRDRILDTSDKYKTFVPAERYSESPSGGAGPVAGRGLKVMRLISPSSRKMGGVLLTALLVLIFVVLVSETLKFTVKKGVARTEVQVRTAALFEAPDQASRHIRSLRFGTPLDVLEQLSSKDQKFVHVHYVSDDGDSVSGYVQTKELGKWTSEDPETAWALLSTHRPDARASADDIRSFIDDLNRFRGRFPQSPHMKEADEDVHRFTATLNEQLMAGTPATLPALAANGVDLLDNPADPRLDKSVGEADKLLKQLPDLWDNGDVDAVLALANQILATAPENVQAKRWRGKASKALKELGGQ